MLIKKLSCVVCCSFLVISCDSNNKSGQREAESILEEGNEGSRAEKSEQELVLDEWISKLSDPNLNSKERRVVLQQFGLDKRIPVYDLVEYVTDNLPESDWFEVFFRRINEEEKENILECLRVYPLLDKGKFAKGHCDRSFGLGAGEMAPLEGIEWCLKIEDPKRQSSAVYGLVVGLSRYAQAADYEDAKIVLKRALSCGLFPDYHQDNIAQSFFGKLKERDLLKPDMRECLAGLLSERASGMLERALTKR